MMQRCSRWRLPSLAALALSGACTGGSGLDASWHALTNLEAQGWLISTTASPSGDVWLVVGGTPDRGLILREAAPQQWTAEQTPGVPLLNWAQVFADKTSFAVGKAGTILHFDGSSWSLQTSGTRQDLWGVWGQSSSDVWAVGGTGQTDGQATLLHYDGTSWQAVTLPALQRPNVWAFYKVWGASADDVYIVGQNGVLLHYDGAGWSEQGVGVGDDLIAIWGVSQDRVVAVGGRSSGVIATYDGAHWTSKTLAPLPGLNGVWMGDREHIHVAGIDGTLAELDFASLSVRPDYQKTDLIFHALHGAGTRLLAVGGNLGASAAPYLGLARERELESP